MIRDRALEVVKRLGKTFGGFTPGQKAVTLIGIVAIVGGGFLFAKWAAKPTYAPLFSNLSSTDASAIVDKLNSGGTAYQLALHAMDSKFGLISDALKGGA